MDLNRVKICVLGGSGVSTPEFVHGIAKESGLPPVEIVLWGRSREKMELVCGVAQKICGDRGRVTVSFTADLPSALSGSALILNQVRVGGLEARAFDEKFPREIGLVGEETVGVGGFANAHRTLPAVLDLCRVIESEAPGALVINLTNPSSLVQHAMEKYSKVKVIGVCDAPVSAMNAISKVLGLPIDASNVGYIGMHHLGWITSVKVFGQDYTTRVLEQYESLGFGIDGEVARALGVIPTGYLKYFYHTDRFLGPAPERTRANDLLELQEKILEDYQCFSGNGKPESLSKRKANWYELAIVPVMSSILSKKGGTFILNLGNTAGYLGVSKDTILELPCALSVGDSACGAVLRPVEVPCVSEDIRARISMNAAYEELSVEAIVEKNRHKALRALMSNPLCLTYDKSHLVLEKIGFQ